MTPINETEFRRILATALGQENIKNPHVLELVTSYLTTGASVSIDEIVVPYYDMSALETDIDAVLFGLERPVQNLSWVSIAYENLLTKYPSPQT